MHCFSYTTETEKQTILEVLKRLVICKVLKMKLKLSYVPDNFVSYCNLKKSRFNPSITKFQQEHSSNYICHEKDGEIVGYSGYIWIFLEMKL